LVAQINQRHARRRSAIQSRYRSQRRAARRTRKNVAGKVTLSN
jgi:hypothetical protein